MRANFPITAFGLCTRLCACLLLLLASQPLLGQEDSIRSVPDSVRVRLGLQYSPAVSFRLWPGKFAPDDALLRPELPRLQPVYSLHSSLYLPYSTNPSPLFRGDYRTEGVLWQFPGGRLVGSGGQTSLPGIGRFNEASVGYVQALGPRLSLSLSMDAMKVNMMHTAGQAFGASGALRYQAADRLAFKVFGSYAAGPTYGMFTHSYGATVSMDLSDRFNLEMGVQRYYNAYRGCWETAPVVIPTYDFGKFKLGMDVGGLIYQILRSTVFERDDRHPWGATIAPPRFHLPPLR